jgi:hypothetical protein
VRDVYNATSNHQLNSRKYKKFGKNYITNEKLYMMCSVLLLLYVEKILLRENRARESAARESHSTFPHIFRKCKLSPFSLPIFPRFSDNFGSFTLFSLPQLRRRPLSQALSTISHNSSNFPHFHALALALNAPT